MMPFVFAVKRDARLKAICVGYITKEKNPIVQFFTRRAIILGGPCLADDCTSEELSLLLSALRSQLSTQAIYIETRNYHDYSHWKETFIEAGLDYKPHLNFHFDCTDKDTLWQKLSDTRKRQIKKANKSGAEILTSQDVITEQDIREWYAILAQVYKKKVKTPLFPVEFFLDFYRRQVGRYILVRYSNRIIGGIMAPILKDKCIYEWYVCGLDADYKDQYPSVMATWAVMEYANEHAIPMFDIMGAGKPDIPYGVRDFKAEFGGRLVEYGRFLHICKPLLYRIGSFGVRLLKSSNR